MHPEEVSRVPSEVSFRLVYNGAEIRRRATSSGWIDSLLFAIAQDDIDVDSFRTEIVPVASGRIVVDPSDLNDGPVVGVRATL
ncbi:hypothetical protein GCM10028857_15750 [Salinarchaeum chitinilyticum]